MVDDTYVEGSGITKRLRKRAVKVDPDTQEGSDRLASFLKRAGPSDPWERFHRPDMKAVAEAFADERAKRGEHYKFKPREDIGWYLQRLLTLDRAVQHHILKGNASWAAHEAALFGEAYSELQMKLTWEKDAIAGRKSYEGAQEGARLRGTSDKIVDRKTKFFTAYDEARGRDKHPTISRQLAAKAAGYNDDYARRLLAKR